MGHSRSAPWARRDTLRTGRLDIQKIRPIARLGYYDCTTVDHVFEMVTPGADQAELAGLEGTSSH